MTATNDLPPGLSAPAQRALAAAGLHSLAQVAATREADVARLHGMGPRGIRLLREALAAKGLSFAGGKA